METIQKPKTIEDWVEFALHSRKQVRADEIRDFLARYAKKYTECFQLTLEQTPNQDFEIEIWSGKRKSMPGRQVLMRMRPSCECVRHVMFSFHDRARAFSRFARQTSTNIGLGLGDEFALWFCANPRPCHQNLVDYLSCGVWTTERTGPKSFSVRELPVTAKQDELGFPHCVSGPAIEWRDGYDKGFFLHGVRFDEPTFEKLTKRALPAKEAIALSNIAQRAEALRFLGAETVLSQLKSTKIDSMSKLIKGNEYWYILYRVNLHDEGNNRYARFIKVTCPSTQKESFLRVPPETKTCLEALAWGFGVEPEEYAELEVET